jgi:signal transduction histidine kinase
VTGDDLDDAALRRLLAKVIGALGHDLRTPLGTIVNYASVLEGDPVPAAEEVRDIADRVRLQAKRVVDVAQLLSDALLLVASPPESTTGEAKSLMQAVLDSMNCGIRLVSPPARPEDEPGAVELDPRIVGFAVQAWLAVERIVRPELPREARLRVERLDRHVRLDLEFDGGADLPVAGVPIDDYVRDVGVKIPPARRFALEIAVTLLDCCDGKLTLSGKPGRASALRLELAQGRRRER